VEKQQVEVDICTLYGYGWERQLTTEDLVLLSHAIDQAENLTDTEHAAARHVLGVEVNQGYGKWHEKVGRAVIRQRTSPITCGIKYRELILPDDPSWPWRSAEVADMLGLPPSKLRDLGKRARKGKLPGLLQPSRNVGRSKSSIGWYVWTPAIVRAWYQAMVAGRFDNWRSRTRARKG